MYCIFHLQQNHIAQLKAVFLTALIIALCLFVAIQQTRHQNGDTHFLTLDEILDETKLLDIGMKQKQWLMNEVRIYRMWLMFVLFMNVFSALKFLLIVGSCQQPKN